MALWFQIRFFSYFPHYKPMLDNDAPGHGQLGHGWQDL